MKKSRSSSSDLNNNKSNNMKKPPPMANDDEEEEEDRKPAARSTNTTDSETDAPTDQSIGSHGSSSTTVAATPLILSSPTAKGSDLTLQLATIEESHHHANQITSPLGQFQTQAVILGGTSLLSVFAFISIVIPASALVALGLFFVSFSLLLYQTYQFLLNQYGEIINSRGIGDFLPGWLFSMLVEDSIHDQLLDDSFAVEWRHMALYFFPGLTRAQIDSYVDRLAPRHRDFLLRPGAGHVLGDNFMQLILGRERFPEIPEGQEVQMQNPAPLPPPMNIASRRLDLADDDSSAESDLGLQISGNDLAGGLSNGQAQQMARSLGLPQQQQEQQQSTRSNSIPREAIVSTPANASDNDGESDQDSEMDLLMEAFSAGMTSLVTGPVFSVFMHFAGQATSLVTRPSVSLVLVGGSVSVFGFWRGLWGRQRQTPAANGDIWATAILGGGMAGMLYMARQATRKKSAPPSASKKK